MNARGLDIGDGWLEYKTLKAGARHIEGSRAKHYRRMVRRLDDDVLKMTWFRPDEAIKGPKIIYSMHENSVLRPDGETLKAGRRHI